MTGPVTFRAPLRILSRLFLVALPIWSGSACSVAQGTTPDCKDNVTAEGIQVQDNACFPFPVCRDENGNEADPATVCCKSLKDDNRDADYKRCLIGFGVAPPPSNSSGQSSSSGGGDGSGGGGGGGGADGGGGAGGK